MTDTLDVRPILAAGEEPLETILAAAREVPVGGALTVIAPFEPQPLYRVLGAQGFAHDATPLGGGDMAVRFTQTGITPDTLVREIHERHPKTGPVFAELGMDLCCGGAKPLAVAAAAHGVALEDLLARLRAIAAG
jgi:uncharacterized protein (DUF2249 family)